MIGESPYSSQVLSPCSVFIANTQTQERVHPQRPSDLFSEELDTVTVFYTISMQEGLEKMSPSLSPSIISFLSYQPLNLVIIVSI